MPIPSDIARLRSRIAALEGAEGEAMERSVPVGIADVDAVLPCGGVPLGRLHETVAQPYPDGIPDGSAPAFAAVLLGRLAVSVSRPVLWVASGDEPYAPGLAAFGLPPERVVMVRAYRAAQALWAVEEGLHCRALAGVFAETWGVDLTAARRLHLAARRSGVAAMLLNHGTPIGPAATRWRIGVAPGRGDAAGDATPGVGPWRWRVELLRCRGCLAGDDGMVGAWDVEWDDEARGLRLAAPAGDRTAVPERRRAVG